MQHVLWGDTVEIKDRPIGFFDSGVGGISVLKEAIRLLPKENFIYYGDSKNAPYGTKSVQEVRELCFKAADFLVKNNVKALVVACNTATSAAINELREEYKYMPVIGIEPALKPAVKLKKQGKILIMATPMTLLEKKFNDLMNKYNKEAEIVPIPCPELVEFIEDGKISGSEISTYLKNRLCPYIEKGVGAIVLGCTHYPFVKKEITSIAQGISIIDGSLGTVKQLMRELSKNKMLSNNNEGKVEIYNSLNNSEIIALSNKLLKL